jgi:hypothetical protein
MTTKSLELLPANQLHPPVQAFVQDTRNHSAIFLKKIMIIANLSINMGITSLYSKNWRNRRMFGLVLGNVKIILSHKLT